jgi:UDP-N-acetylmuramate dehydrogenase
MKGQVFDVKNKQYSSTKNYIPLKDNLKATKFSLHSKLLFSLIILVILFFLFSNVIRNKNKQIQKILSRKSIDINTNENFLISKFKSILDNDEIFENEMMKLHTTFHLGGPAKYYIKPKSINKIIKILQLCKEYSIEYFILGNGSNLLVSDNGYDGLIINILEPNFSELKTEKIDDTTYQVIVGGGILMRNLAIKMCLLSLTGLEDIIDIPGTIGGGIIMNASAGSKGLIYNSLEKVKVITPKGEIKELSKTECELRHRGSKLQDNKYIVIEATFKMMKGNKIEIQKTMTDHTSLRYSRQPMYFPSAGCFFIWNKPKFGSLYEKYLENNLVSYKVGDAMIYTHNIAFIVNLGDAKSKDVFEIVIHIEKIIKLKYNIDIKREVVVLGDFT